jgi:processive 1,2-diacylglycerol beta-glucosyltransferase
MKKILVASASIGAGHDRAADAIDAACKERFADRAASRWFNVLAVADPKHKAVYADGYNFIANRTPGFWGALYRLFYHGARSPVQSLIKKTDARRFRPVADYIRKEAPDILICTHFLPVDALLDGRSPRPRFAVYVVVTDYDCHSLWINPRASGYFAGNEFVRSILIAEGFPQDRVRVTGIPIHPLFSRERNLGEIRRDVGLADGKPVILVMGGGFGVSSVKEAFRRLLKIDCDAQMVVVCGKNEKLRKDLERIARGDPRPRIFGFRRDVHDLMQASDFIISKAGGATVSESLARGLPMLIFSPTPGQEVRNKVYLMERGAALLATDPSDLEKKARMLLEHPRVLGNMRRKAHQAARPDAAYQVVRLALEHHDGDWKASMRRSRT